MGRELYFFKFDAEIAREKLPLLIDKEEDFSFRHYISMKGESMFDIIMKKITENIELVSEDELWYLYNWFYERKIKPNAHLPFNYHIYGENIKCIYEEMRSCGLDLFFEIPSKTPAGIFSLLCGDYQYLVAKDIDNPYDANQLVDFLDYGACFLAELRFVVNKYYYKKNDDCEDNLEVKRIINEMHLSSNSSYYKLALSEMERRRTSDIAIIESLSEVIKFRQTMKNESSYSYPIEFTEALDNESDFLNSCQMLETFSEIKKKIGNYTGKIIILDSNK